MSMVRGPGGRPSRRWCGASEPVRRMLAALDRPPAPSGRGGSRRLPVLGPALGPALRASSVCGAHLGSAPGRFPPRFGRAARRLGGPFPPAGSSRLRRPARGGPASGGSPCRASPLPSAPPLSPAAPLLGPLRAPVGPLAASPPSLLPARGGAVGGLRRPFALRAPRAPGPSVCACIRSGGVCLRRPGPGAAVCKAMLLVRIEKSMLDNRALSGYSDVTRCCGSGA